MPSAAIPAGVLPDAAAVTLTSHRSVRRVYELVDRDGGVLRALDGVRGASLSEVANATLKRGGRASITDVGQNVDWLTARIKASYEIEGYGSWGLGVFLPSAPDGQWSEGVRRWDVELLDVATVLAEATLENGYSLDAGTVVTDAIRALITAAGETSIAVTDSDKTLTTARVWDPGASYLAIINELCDAIGYLALASDGDGRLACNPYIRPADRPVSWAFADGVNCIYRPTFTVSQDLYKIPNHQQAKTRGTGDTAGIVVNVYNDDPDSPYSRANRGRTISGEILELDAADEASLTTAARRLLLERTQPTQTVVIDAMPVPLSVNAAVTFRSTSAGIDGRFVVSRIEYGANDTDLASYTLQKVVDI